MTRSKTAHVTNIVGRRAEEVKDLVKAEMEKWMTKKVAWQIEDIDDVKAAYPKGRCMMSQNFFFAGAGRFYIKFYPNGIRDSPDGKCALFLNGQPGYLVSATLGIAEIDGKGLEPKNRPAFPTSGSVSGSGPPPPASRLPPGGWLRFPT